MKERVCLFSLYEAEKGWSTTWLGSWPLAFVVRVGTGIGVEYDRRCEQGNDGDGEPDDGGERKGVVGAEGKEGTGTTLSLLKSFSTGI